MKLTDEVLKQLVIKTLNEAKDSTSKPFTQAPKEGKRDGKISSDSKGAKVSVKANSKPVKDQVKPSFKEKTSAPKGSVSDPFTEKAKENALDKLDKAPKTAAKVEKIAPKGKAVNSKTGAQKGSFKSKATKPEQPKRIAKPAFTMKESYTKQDLAKFIYQQAKKSLE